MNITDEKLSAFLDAELPDAEMEVIRDALIADEDLADRLAELAMVDELVAVSYATIDTRPVPESINALLLEEPLVVSSAIQDAEEISAKKSKPETAKIIAFPMMQKFQNILQKQMAIAASVVMIIGLGAVQLLHESNSSGNWNNIAKVLDTAPSGIAQASLNGVEIKPRLTFINKDGEYCRQFDMTDKHTATENIACRKDNKWQLTVSVTLDKAQQENNYRTASGGSLLDSTIDQMADGDFFDARAEAEAIEQHWLSKK
jgi:negative regulator of sigma E activity